MRPTLPAVSAILGLLAISSANAGPIDAIYAFGDSLSDTGNDFIGTGGAIPGAPYFPGRFSNGPIWIDDLGLALGLPVAPSLAGGTNFSYGGAETGVTPVHTTPSQIDLLGPTGQIAQFSATHSTADPNALYTIWIGSNDLADVLAANPTPAALQADLGAIVTNIDTSILDLAALGARHFLIVTVPDLGKAPVTVAAGPVASAAASAVAAAFDNTLVSGGGPLPSLAALAASHGLTLNVFDSYSLLDSIVANGAAFGFTNTTTSCLTGDVNYAGGTPCSSSVAIQNQFVFWDERHPTSAAHALIADAALALVDTPEPSSFLAFTGGLALIGGFVRRLRRTQT